MNRGDVSEIVIATDAGREGEPGRHYWRQELLPLKVMDFITTDKAILDGFKNLKQAVTMTLI